MNQKPRVLLIQCSRFFSDIKIILMKRHTHSSQSKFTLLIIRAKHYYPISWLVVTVKGVSKNQYKWDDILNLKESVLNNLTCCFLSTDSYFLHSKRMLDWDPDFLILYLEGKEFMCRVLELLAINLYTENWKYTTK